MMAQRKVPAARPAGTVTSLQAAELLGVSKPTFFRYRQEPDFPVPVHVGPGGRGALYKAEDIIAWRDRRISAAGGEHNEPNE
jgi:predicted DNA-binding transcriptional regulator AlpA